MIYRTVIIVYLCLCVTSCTNFDKYSGNYILDSKVINCSLVVTKSKQDKSNYKFEFISTGDSPGSLTFVSKIDNDGKVLYVDGNEVFANSCTMKLQFFDGNINVEQQGGCGAPDVERHGSYKKNQEKQDSNNIPKNIPKATIQGEQKVVFIADTITGGGMRYNTPFSCAPSLCSEFTGNINNILSEGWKIISSHQKEVAAGYENCACSGTEYVLQH